MGRREEAQCRQNDPNGYDQHPAYPDRQAQLQIAQSGRHVGFGDELGATDRLSDGFGGHRAGSAARIMAHDIASLTRRCILGLVLEFSHEKQRRHDQRKPADEEGGHALSSCHDTVDQLDWTI